MEEESPEGAGNPSKVEGRANDAADAAVEGEVPPDVKPPAVEGEVPPEEKPPAVEGEVPPPEEKPPAVEGEVPPEEKLPAVEGEGVEAEKTPSTEEQKMEGSVQEVESITKSADDAFRQSIERIRTSYGSAEFQQTLQAEDAFDRYPSEPDLCPTCGQAVIECADLALLDRLADSGSRQLSGVIVAKQVMKEVLKKALKRKPKEPKVEKTRNVMMLPMIIKKFKIDQKTFQKMLFRENLLIAKFSQDDLSPTPVGAMCLDVQAARGGPVCLNKEKDKSDYYFPKFCVHVSSQFDYNGHNGGSRITAWVDKELQTLEEMRKEYISTEEGIEMETIYVNAQECFYYMRYNKTDEKFYSYSKARNLICEGSNFLLMRYLAIKRFVGRFEVSTVYINGDLCRNYYFCKGPQSGMVYGKKLDVCKIHRTILEKCGIEHKCKTLLTLEGRILKQEWLTCDYLLQLNPSIYPLQGKPAPDERVPLDQMFDKDLQMLSLYLDTKVSTKKKVDSYMHDHPEIRDFISDYVATILQLKPENVFDFTAHYFLGFAPQLLPYTEYFQPPSPSPESISCSEESSNADLNADL